MVAPRRGSACCAPTLFFANARPPDSARARAGVCRARDSGVALSGAACLSGAARSAPGPATRRRGERREGRAGLWRWDETGGMVLSLHHPPPTSTTFTTSTTCRRPSLVLWQRRDRRRDLAHRAGVSAARHGRTGRRLSGLRREGAAGRPGPAVPGGP